MEGELGTLYRKWTEILKKVMEKYMQATSHFNVPYLLSYMIGVFYCKNCCKDLDPTCKMDLDLWALFWKCKTHVIAEFVVIFNRYTWP